MNKLRSEMKKLSIDLGLSETVECTCSESKEFELLRQKGLPLPKNITNGNIQGLYLKYIETDLSEEEIRKLILFRQTKDLQAIKNSLLFFVILTVISLLIGVVMALNIFQ